LYPKKPNDEITRNTDKYVAIPFRKKIFALIRSKKKYSIDPMNNEINKSKIDTIVDGSAPALIRKNEKIGQ
jgi:hypothetical protein